MSVMESGLAGISVFCAQFLAGLTMPLVKSLLGGDLLTVSQFKNLFLDLGYSFVA